MKQVKATASDARNAAAATSAPYRTLAAALNGERIEHGPNATRLRRRLSRAKADMERAAGEELASAFVTAGSTKFSEALAEAAFTALGGDRGRAAVAAIPHVAQREVDGGMTVIVQPKPAKVRRQGVTVSMIMAVAAGELHRDATLLRFTAAKAGNAIREGIRTLAAQQVLSRSLKATKRFVAGVPKKALPLAVGASLIGAAAIGQEVSLDWSGRTEQFVSADSGPTWSDRTEQFVSEESAPGYRSIAEAGEPAPDAEQWTFPITIKASTVGFVGGEDAGPGGPSRAFLELAHRALSITLKDETIAATQVSRAVDAMRGCMNRDQPCRIETLGIMMDPSKGHHTVRLLPSAGYSLEAKGLGFDFQGTYYEQDEVAAYVNETYDAMFGHAVDIAPKH